MARRELMRQGRSVEAEASTRRSAIATTGSNGDDQFLRSRRPMKVSGWMNVSTTLAFNTLHDHGDALWRPSLRRCRESPPTVTRKRRWASGRDGHRVFRRPTTQDTARTVDV